MIVGPDQRYKPVQPMGWPINAHINVAQQARAEAEAHRRRADQLARRNRQLRAWLSAGLGLVVLAAVAAGAVGAVVGFALGSGLLGMVTR